MYKKLELLAPAGNKESFYAAVNSGADSVYLGGKLFSARQYSDNFENDEMVEVIKYAHNKDVKVYVTINTLLKNNELQSALKYAEFLYNIDVDGVIVQDLGLIYLLNRFIPDLKINISTQASIYDLNGINFFEKYNVNKYILARELSINEIKEISEKTDKDLEVFIHGALCMSYSGQCYFSSFLGGRSGNRGKCAQPCRLNYSIYDNKKDKINDQYKEFPLFSLKDYMVGEKIEDLMNAGVNCFKIEGRMKQPVYTAVVVEYYRRIIDNIIKNNKNIKLKDLEDKVISVFSRGFTDGYLAWKNSSDMFAQKSSGQISKDVNEIISEFSDRFNSNSISRRNELDISTKFLRNEYAVLEIKDKKNIVKVYSEEKIEDSINNPISCETIKEQLEKLGNTIYTPGKIDIIADDNIYIKRSEINKLRRKAIDKLFNKSGVIHKGRKKININYTDTVAVNKKINLTEISLKISNKKELESVDLSKVGRLYLPIESDINVKKLKNVFRKDIYLWIPNIVNTKQYEFINNNIEMYQEIFDGVCVNNIGTFWFFNKNSNLKIHCGYFMNILNSYSVKLLEESGANGITYSIESNIKDIDKISKTTNIHTELAAFIYICVMTMKNCPLSLTKKCSENNNCSKCNIYDSINLIDRKGAKLNIEKTNYITKLYNSVPLSIIGKVNKFLESSINYYLIDSKWIDNVSMIVDTLYDELNNNKPDNLIYKKLLKENTFTRGHYFKNVL